jgi:transposase
MQYCIGIDVHRKFSQVCVLDQMGHTVRESKLYHEDVRQMAEFFAGFATATPVAMEATIGWMWITDMLQERGLEVHLAHPPGVRLIAQSRLKTDRVDARVLAQLLRTGFLPEAYFAPPQVRDHRMLLRHRLLLVKNRTIFKNKVHAVLARHNVQLHLSDIFGVSGTETLRQLALPKHSKRILDGLLDCIEFLNRQILDLQNYLYRVLKADPRIEWLTSIPGIGKLTAHYLLGEIGEVGCFPSAKKLVSYAGLCPSTRRSANTLWHGPTGPAGRSLMKWALVEATHVAIRHDSYFASVFHNVKGRKCKQKAYIAAARKMAQVIWHILREQRPYQRRHERPRVGSISCVAAEQLKGAPTC